MRWLVRCNVPGCLERTKGKTTRRRRIGARITGDLRGTMVTAVPSGSRVPLSSTTTPFFTRPDNIMPPLSSVPLNTVKPPSMTEKGSKAAVEAEMNWKEDQGGSLTRTRCQARLGNAFRRSSASHG
jgi:hypothetical protein